MKKDVFDLNNDEKEVSAGALFGKGMILFAAVIVIAFIAFVIFKVVA